MGSLGTASSLSSTCGMILDDSPEAGRGQVLSVDRYCIIARCNKASLTCASVITAAD